MRKLWLMVVLGLAGLYGLRLCSPITHAPGVLVRTEPQQVDFTTAQAPIVKSGWTLKPLATFTMQARVLGSLRYDDGPPAQIVPYDLAVGWGPMSDTGVLDRIDIRQSYRFYHWTYWGTPPVSEQVILSHSCNIHVIPADDGILETLKSIRKGSLIRLAGVLVEASHPQGDKPWRSSLTRTDTGEGACEIVYVKSLLVQ